MRIVVPGRESQKCMYTYLAPYLFRQHILISLSKLIGTTREIGQQMISPLAEYDYKSSERKNTNAVFMLRTMIVI